MGSGDWRLILGEVRGSLSGGLCDGILGCDFSRQTASLACTAIGWDGPGRKETNSGISNICNATLYCYNLQASLGMLCV